MIRNIIASILVAFPAIALAQVGWVEMRPGTFFNKPESGEVYLAATLNAQDEVQHMFIGYEGFYCYPGESKVVGYVGDFRVNDQPLHFELSCMNGNEIYIPQSDRGKEFLSSEVEKADRVLLDLGAGRQFEYDVFGYETIERVIKETNANAM